MVAVASPRASAKVAVKAPKPLPAAAKDAAAVASVTHRLTGSIGTMIDAMWAVREHKRALEAQIKEATEKLDAYEDTLMAKMKADGLDKATGKEASVSFTSTTAAAVEDWDGFYAYIKKTGYFHLLQKRVSDPAYRELLAAGKKVPGVQPFSKTRINLRSLAT